MSTLPATMTCVEIKTPGGPEALVPAIRPVPLPKDGEVLIKVAATGVNRPDIAQRSGSYPPPPGASDLPGLEVAGTIIAGDAAIIKQYLLYRTYHGSVMSGSVQAASMAAWKDEQHVVENRRLYVDKFKIAIDTLKPAIDLPYPDAAFYLWIPTPIDDAEFTRRLFIEKHMTVLPGSFLGRASQGINPGRNRVRVALVSTLGECAESAARLRDFFMTL